jgi:hypothetical protein
MLRRAVEIQMATISDTRILFDQNGGGDGFITLATLKNTANITPDDLVTGT